MKILDQITQGVIAAVQQLYGETVNAEQVSLSPTKKEFEGDYTLVVFPFSKIAKKSPPQIAAEIGTFLVENLSIISSFNAIQGFLNLSINEVYWHQFLNGNAENQRFGQHTPKHRKVMVEFSSPNTNKPLHLGHIRNILLGWSCSKILEAAGYEVKKVQIINDRGIAICKSMLAWKKWGKGITPDSSGIKGDHLVGNFYVEFERQLQAEYEEWMKSDEARKVAIQKMEAGQTEKEFFKKYREIYFNQDSALGREAREMLLKWESGDLETIQLWKMMNGWVYEGFDGTYSSLGVYFDKLYYESQTYLLGKDIVQEGLQKGVFYKKPDGSVWCDLTDAGLDQKVILRADGTSVYITQDLGTARMRYEELGTEKMIYVVADEQNYHFQVLFEILKKLGEPYASGLYHLNYGMVDLPTGKMKSREGTVVDADDLMNEVIKEAENEAAERGELAELETAVKQEIIRKIGLAALKFFIIKVSPRKRMTFDPKESVDMQGQTGPYVQNAYVRIKSVLRKANADGLDLELTRDYHGFQPQEKELLTQLSQFPDVIEQAANNYDPSDIANYCFNLAKEYHRFYHDLSILKAETPAARVFRIRLSAMVANVLNFGMEMLGIEMPERM